MADAKSRSVLNMPDSKSKSGMAMADTGSKSQAAMVDRSFSKMRTRRQSFGFTSKVPGITPTGPRVSQFGLEFKRPPLVFYPTYQLESLRPAKNDEMLAAINNLLDANFTGHKYNVQDSPALVLRLSGEILRKLKTLEYNRYRFIVIVTLGQKRAQCYNNAITFLWDHERDTYVDTHRQTNSAFIQVTAFAIYLD